MLQLAPHISDPHLAWKGYENGSQHCPVMISVAWAESTEVSESSRSSIYQEAMLSFCVFMICIEEMHNSLCGSFVQDWDP